MSKTTDLKTLDPQRLARVVPHLAPETLQQLIHHYGLEASGEIISSATPAQLTALVDLDLWRHTEAGRDDEFDADRFGEWLEVLADTGQSDAARVVASLDKNVVAAGLSRYVRVFDPGIFEPIAQSDDEAIDRREAMLEGGGDGMECEVGGYILRARRTDVWDAIISLLVTLDEQYSNDFHDVMERCRNLSNSTPEFGGLDDLLLEPEQHLHDITIEREQRRSQQGYASPADARAFLQMARQPKDAGSEPSVNPIVTAYFRAANEEPDEPESPKPSAPADAPPSTSDVDAVMELLVEAGMVPEQPRALLGSATADPKAARLAELRRVMTHVGAEHEAVYFTRSHELAFLANTLIAGCSVQSRPFTPQEASDAAAAICNLGLESWPGTGAALPDAFLVDHDLVSAFEVGWAVLHRDVSLYVADALIAMFADVRSIDRDIRSELVAFRRALVKQRDAGTPWKARGAGEVLAALDVSAWISVRGLLDECPILPAALRAALVGSAAAVDQKAFEFISTTAEIEDVRAFMRKLPDLLAP